MAEPAEDSDKAPGKGRGTGPGSTPCPDCPGSGRVALLISSKPCVACGGTGCVPLPVAPKAMQPEKGGGAPGGADAGATPEMAVPAGEVVNAINWRYDGRSRLVRVTVFPSAVS